MPAKNTQLVLLSVVLSIGGLAFAKHACAQGGALAEKLFQDGRQLFTSGDYDAACPKFAESYRLDAGAGTLLNLAACHEKQGKTATAWSEYELARQKLLQNSDRRASFAEERSTALKGELSYVTVHVPADARVDGLTVDLDGVRVGRAVWGTELPVDPGERRLRAVAPGHEEWSIVLQVLPNGKDESVNVPALRRSAVKTSNDEYAAETTESESAVLAGEQGGISTPAIVSGSATLAMAALFTVSGLIRQNEIPAAEDKTHPENESARAKVETWDIINLAAAGGMLIGAGFTTYFLVRGNDPEESTPTATLSPWLGPGLGGASLSGRF